MKISYKTRKYCKQILAHPYAGMRILPFIGDFVGHAKNINKSLFAEGVINEKEFNNLNKFANMVEKHENETALNQLLGTYKMYAEWE